LLKAAAQRQCGDIARRAAAFNERIIERMRGTVSYFGRTNFHRAFQPFGFRQSDRLTHTYVIGKTGVGKSTLLETLAVQDAHCGRGFALVDPHGDLVNRVMAQLPAASRDRVIYLDAPDPRQPFGYNPLRRVRADKIPLAASGILETLRKLWPDAWGMRMEHVFRNCLYALLERDGSRLPDILLLLQDEDFRKLVVQDITNETVRTFWEEEYESYPARLRAEAISPIQNKLGALLSDPMLYRVLVEPEIDLRFRALMDDGKILLVNLSKGRIGEDSAHILGGLIVSTLGLAAFSRAETPAEGRRPFFLYLDEFQNFTTLSLINMMSELRKYGVGLILAHQHLHQLSDDIRHAVLGNAGTLIAFRVGPEDASVLAKEFQPDFDVLDLLNLPNRSIYLKLMIDGAPSKPFSADALAPQDIAKLLAEAPRQNQAA
jgi:energy-coupling factor transporter ATP-binding protein EcfA2